MTDTKVLKRGERGFAAIAVVVAIGAIVTILGITILFSTDAQLRGSTLGMITQNSDWTVRSSIKLVEEAWRNYIGIERIDATTFQGTVYDDVERYSRDQGLIEAINRAQINNNPNFSLLILLYETMNDTVNLDTTTMPRALIYQVDLTRDKPGFTNYQDGIDASDGIVFVAQVNADGTTTAVRSVNNPDNDNDYDIVWNNIGDGDRQFNAIITVTPNGLPDYSSDLVYFVFPVRFEVELTVRYKDNVEKIVHGLGSCSFYVYRRSFSEYLVFSDIFTTENDTDIIIPRGFTYTGPVHTNTRFSFTSVDGQGAIFNDVVTQHEKQAIFNGRLEPLDSNGEWKTRTEYNNCAPTFEKGFTKGVAEIPAPTVEDLGDIARGVLQGAPAPTEPGVYLTTVGDTLNTGDTLEKGGIYIKGNVTSLTLAQGDRTQTYNITQKGIRGATTTSAPMFTDNNGNTTTESKATRKIITKTTPIKDFTYTITCNYRTNKTHWQKVTSNYTETVTEVYTKNQGKWRSTPSSTTTEYSQPVEDTEIKDYNNAIDVVEAPVGHEETPQAAIYIDGKLGEGKAGTTNIPTGLSGTVDKETELTICAKESIVIAGDTIYERADGDKGPDHPEEKRLAEQGILGIIAMTGKVYIDFPNPNNKSVNIDASIMAVNDSIDKSMRGVLTALDYQADLGNPFINLYGGVIQKYYGAVGQSSNPPTGYARNFRYDPRLKTSPPPLYPRQAACRMQLKNEVDSNTLQLVWDY